MKTTVLVPEGFDNYLKIQNARERLEEARDISRKLLDGGIALKAMRITMPSSAIRLGC